MRNKLHIGPGTNYLPGWKNVDVFSSVRADIHSSALAMPFERESFDLIYASHVLEHFTRFFVLAALTHWRDLLKPGGVLRLAVPDFEAICTHYMKHYDLSLLAGLLYGGQDNMVNAHQVAFDEFTLTVTLKKVGFVEVRPWEWRETSHVEFDDFSQAYLPHMDKRNGMLMSLNLEAVK